MLIKKAKFSSILYTNMTNDFLPDKTVIADEKDYPSFNSQVRNLIDKKNKIMQRAPKMNQ